MVLQRRRGGNLGLLLLGSQIMNFGLQNIPPVTLALLGGQVAVFLGVFPKIFPSPNSVCMSSYLVLEHKAWKRMLLATFYHADDMHLYFNMVSLLYKGSMLERKFGNIYFAYLVALFSGLTSLVYVGLGFALDSVLSDQSYYLSCAVGFSGVLFALKVLTTHYSPAGMQYALGFIPVPSKYIFWVELVLIQMITPNASFVGHLAGILVGLLYTKGPLKALMDSFMAPGAVMDFSQPNRSGRRQQPSFGSRLFGQSNPPSHPPAGGMGRNAAASGSGNFYGSGRATPSAPRNTDYENDSGESETGAYSDYTGGLTEEQQYERAMEESIRESYRQTTRQPPPPSQPPPPGAHSSHSQRLYPDLDDLRSRRRNFYQ